MKKLIVITGASSGFGKELAKIFSGKGYSLALFARNKGDLEKLNIAGAFLKSVDVKDRDALVLAVKEAEKHFSLPVDCMINSAGIMPLGVMDTQDPKEWDEMIDVNIKGVLNGIYATYKGMTERRMGTIINISSIAGKKAFDLHAVYCGTKFAVHAISDQLRKEAGAHNVRIITIAPGASNTNLLNSTSDKSLVSGYEDWKKSMGGALNPAKVAESIVFTYEMPQEVCIRELVIAAINQGD